MSGGGQMWTHRSSRCLAESSCRVAGNSRHQGSAFSTWFFGSGTKSWLGFQSGSGTTRDLVARIRINNVWRGICSPKPPAVRRWTRFWRAAASRSCDLTAAAADATPHPALEWFSLQLLHLDLHKEKSPILGFWARLMSLSQHRDQEDGVWRNFDGHQQIDLLSVKIDMSSVWYILVA